MGGFEGCGGGVATSRQGGLLSKRMTGEREVIVWRLVGEAVGDRALK